MLRPSFHEIPVGFSTTSVVSPPSAHGITSTGFHNPNVVGYLEEGGDITSINMRSNNTVAVTSNQWSAVGVSIPWSYAEREAYCFSIVSMAQANVNVRLCPFIGFTTVTSGLATIQVADMLPLDVEVFGFNPSCSCRGHVRPVLAYDTVPSDPVLVFGVAFMNYGGSTANIDRHRTTFNVTRFNQPDLGLQVVVQ